MTSSQVVKTSVTNNSSFQNYPHLDDHTGRSTDTSGFKPFTICYWPLFEKNLSCVAWQPYSHDNHPHSIILIRFRHKIEASWSCRALMTVRGECRRKVEYIAPVLISFSGLFPLKKKPQSHCGEESIMWTKSLFTKKYKVRLFIDTEVKHKTAAFMTISSKP